MKLLGIEHCYVLDLRLLNTIQKLLLHLLMRIKELINLFTNKLKMKQLWVKMEFLFSLMQLQDVLLLVLTLIFCWLFKTMVVLVVATELGGGLCLCG